MKPVLQALVLADHVYTDRSGKKIIAGTFNQILFSRQEITKKIQQPDGTTKKLVPGGMQAGSPYAYVSLTDICDKTRLTLQFVNLTRNEILFGTEIEVSCRDRLKTVEVVLPLPGLPIREEGTYAFEVVHEGEILGSHRIVGKELDPTEG